jgi:hypothetical protein
MEFAEFDAARYAAGKSNTVSLDSLSSCLK